MSWRLFFPQAPSIEKDDKNPPESSPNQEMTTCSQHYFSSTADGFSISIMEVC